MYGVRLFFDAKREVLIPMRSTTSMLFSALHAHILLLQQIVFFQVIQIFAIAHSYVFFSPEISLHALIHVNKL